MKHTNAKLSGAAAELADKPANFPGIRWSDLLAINWSEL